MNVSFKLLDSNSDITNQILQSIRSYLQPIFNDTQKSLQKSIPNIVKTALSAEPEYNSLISGQLKYELGVPDADSRIDALFDAWSAGVSVVSKPITVRGSKLVGGFSLDLIRSDYSDILNLPSATVTDAISGSVIPWLKWLLLDGSKILVRNYVVQLGPNPRSRTGNAIMTSAAKQNWRIPAQFAGTANNNWITRAIERLDKSLLDHIEQQLETRI